MLLEITGKFAGFLWGWFLIAILLGTGLFLTIRLKGAQFRYFGQIFKNIKHSMKKTDGVSGFGALCASLGSQVGTGNLVGVASALVSGGPGAVFWMWITALVGMATSFSEIVLGMLYRDKNADGSYVGSPCHYMRKGMNSKFLAVGYAVFVFLGIGVVYAMLQCNSVVSAVLGVAPSVSPLIVGICISYTHEFYPLCNTARCVDTAVKAARQVVGEERVDGNCEAWMGSEDFAAFLKEVPGCFVFLGSGSSSELCPNMPLHNAEFDYNDQILITGAKFWAELVRQRLA